MVGKRVAVEVVDEKAHPGMRSKNAAKPDYFGIRKVMHKKCVAKDVDPEFPYFFVKNIHAFQSDLWHMGAMNFSCGYDMGIGINTDEFSLNAFFFKMPGQYQQHIPSPTSNICDTQVWGNFLPFQ